MRLHLVMSLLLAAGTAALAQGTFVVTGSAIPTDLLTLNYGPLPKGIVGFDLSICNAGATKRSVVSSEIYQALAQSQKNLRPIGGRILLAAIIRNQNRSVSTILDLSLSAATSALSVFGATKLHVSPSLLVGSAVGSLVAQQIFSKLKPALTADQVNTFESQVLEQALVLDGGSCVERTVFALSTAPASQPPALSFQVR